MASPPAAFIAARVLAMEIAARSVRGFLSFFRHATKLDAASGLAAWLRISAGVSITVKTRQSYIAAPA